MTLQTAFSPGALTLASLVVASACAGFATGSHADDSPLAGSIASESAHLLVGQWVTDLPIDEDGQTARLVIDIDFRSDAEGRNRRWVGEFDLADVGVVNYPVQVARPKSQVRMFLSAIGMTFVGEFSQDGNGLTGTGTSQGEEEAMHLTRASRKPEFSALFLELEAAADDPSLVEVLSHDGAELRKRFNEDSATTRLLMLLSPT